MPDDGYSVPRIAALYDATCLLGEDTTFYAALAGATPLRALDLGCGTGRLALALAERGHTVTGLDPAVAMLDIARAKPGGTRVTWVEGDGRTMSLGAQFDLIVMAGHVFQAFLSDEDVQAVLRSCRAHLAPGGRLAFETRNPLAREWERWMPETSRSVTQVERLGVVEEFYTVVGVADQLVEFESHNHFRDSEEWITFQSRLRFMPRDELARHLAAAGFTEVDWRGDWRGSPFDDSKPEIIVIAR